MELREVFPAGKISP